jgi:uncharacterized protein with von Willebrand factor type A (vWA) domain
MPRRLALAAGEVDPLAGPVAVADLQRIGQQIVVGEVIRQDLREGGLQIPGLGGGDAVVRAADGEDQGGAGEQAITPREAPW